MCLCPTQVRQLAALLSEEGLSDASYSKASSAVRTLVDVAPVHLSTILVRQRVFNG